MYRYQPDIVAQTKIPGHVFVNWSFTMKFVPPALFLACQTVLIPAIFFQGRWNTAVSAACAASFLVPAATAILGRWILVLRVVHAPLAFLTLGILAYTGGVASLGEWALVGAFMAWFAIYWAIMGAGLGDPLKRMLEVLERAESGDLQARVVLNFERNDEMGRVAARINSMIEAMQRVFGSNNEKVSRNLAEISSRQASTVEEISASLEELLSQTQENSRAAGEANRLMTEASPIIDEANESMSALMRSMQEISKASGETQKIVKTINEVAFQTNLLALNAAVEAARAGEAGAGFAVVADEVRNLAQRAADAAGDTARMIEGTVTRVHDGAKVAERSKTAFDRVVGNSRNAEKLVQEIARGSEVQVEGLQQVNVATEELNKLAQNNAENAEQLLSTNLR